MSIDQEQELTYQNSINSIFFCQKCKNSETSLLNNEITCSKCQPKYIFNQNVLDTLMDPSIGTVSEITGMAFENGFTEENYKDFKVRLLDNGHGYESKLKSTKNDHSTYYL